MSPRPSHLLKRHAHILLQGGLFACAFALLIGGNPGANFAASRGHVSVADSPQTAAAQGHISFYSLEDMFVEAERAQYAGEADPKAGMVCLGEMPSVMRLDTVLSPAQWADQEANGPKFLNLEKVRRSIGYPESAKAKKIEGSVIVKLLVDEQGLVLRYKFIDEVDPILRDAVAAHVEELRLRPGMQDGKVAKWWVILPFHFGKGGC